MKLKFCKLKNNFIMPLDKVQSIMKSLYFLQKEDPTSVLVSWHKTIALSQLKKLAEGSTDYQSLTVTIKEVLEKLNLLQSNGEMDDGVKNVVQTAVSINLITDFCDIHEVAVEMMGDDFTMGTDYKATT